MVPGRSTQEVGRGFRPANSLRHEELFGQRGPVFVGQVRREVIDRNATILRESGSHGYRHSLAEAQSGILGPHASQGSTEQVAEVELGIGRLHSYEPAFSVRIVAGQFRIFRDGFVDVTDRALDRRNHIDRLAVAEDRPNLLSLADPAATLRQSDALNLADKLRSEVVHPNANQFAALVEGPGVSSMVADILWNPETGNHGRDGPGRNFAQDGLNYRLFHQLLLTANVIDCQEDCERQQYHDYCHNHLARSAFSLSGHSRFC